MWNGSDDTGSGKSVVTSLAANSFRPSFEKLAERYGGEREVVMAIRAEYLQRNGKLFDDLVQIFNECLQAKGHKPIFCTSCDETNLVRGMGVVDNKRACPRCGRVHMRTDVSGKWAPTNRRAPSLPLPLRPNITWIRLGSC